MKRRALVLTDESARHPFRSLLPPHARRVVSLCEEGRRETGASGAASGMSRADWRQVGAIYCACFIAASLFIA